MLNFVEERAEQEALHTIDQDLEVIMNMMICFMTLNLIIY